MKLSILPTAESHFEGLRRAIDIVAREKRYLAYLQAPPREQQFAFLRNIIANDLSQFVALLDDVVVGWCDILPTHGEARAHVGTLGIGLVPDARHVGIGAKLIEAALAKAREKGLSRIELTVRLDNANAKALYERFGFAVEGVNRKAFFVDGIFYDTYSMALLR
ncbi:MAG: GNAT family N-acetyltransferase [Burkholderiales bacterium]|nr:GNAT family N-acetyltransferase [Burkholderiales bacterium]